MPRAQKNLQHFKGTTCHIFNRGVQKDKIFLEEEDYVFYLKRIKKYKEIYGIEFLNYSLLPNHFHYTIRQMEDNEIVPVAPEVPAQKCHLPLKANGTDIERTPISKFMHILHNSYAHYFNKKYKRSGHVFQDRYKQRIVEDDAYIMWLSAYINGNAQIHKIVEDAKSWPYSSYLDYIGERNGTICNKEIIKIYFQGADDYKQYTDEVIKNSQEKKDTLKNLEE